MFFGAPLARRQEAGAAEVFIGAQRGRACVLPVPDGLLLSLEEKGLQSFMVTLEQLDSNMPTDTGPEDRPSEFSLLSGIESNRTQKQRGAVAAEVVAVGA